MSPYRELLARKSLANYLNYLDCLKKGLDVMEIIKFREYKKNTLQGFVDIKLNTGIILREFTSHVSNGSEWVNPPARAYKDKDGAEKWARIVDFDDKETYQNFSRQVVKLLKEYEPS